MISKKAAAANGRHVSDRTFRPLDRSKTILRKSTGTASESRINELIGALSESYENRRARQVFEWELARRSRSVDA
jgi:hypothetical protein